MIVVLMLVVVMVFLAIALGYLVGNSTLSSGNHVASMQALFQAESGLEFEQRRWAQNLDWYRSTTDPNPTTATAQVLGAGTFAVNSNLPATLVKNRLTAAGTTLTVYTTGRFPASGILQIEEDLTSNGEFVRYTGIAGNTFTGLSRAQSVGTVSNVASTHVRSDTVYPVTILRTALPANCAALASIQVDANSKFLSAGTLDIEGEEIAYAGSSTSGGTMTLTAVTRCLGLVASVSHAIGQPVTPVNVGGDSASYEVESISTGTRANSIRYARRTIQR
jgi:hypothetical protein